MVTANAQGLKDAMGKYCLIGAAINQWQSDGQVPEADVVIDKHFNCAVAENCMKPESLAPAEGIFDFRTADKFVNYCQQHNLKIIGHCLVWHSQAPDWWFTNGYTASPASKEVLKERLIKHIKTVVGHYKGQIHNGLDYPELDEYEKSIDAFAACGVKVMITELDLNVLPNPEGFGGADIAQNFEFQQKYNPYATGLTTGKAREIELRWMELFKIYYKHRSQISRINLWGVSDGGSWLNGWPIKGRTNYPLLFDRQYKEKPVVDEIINLYK